MIRGVGKNIKLNIDYGAFITDNSKLFGACKRLLCQNGIIRNNGQIKLRMTEQFAFLSATHQQHLFPRPKTK